jgi:hypothetical protein
LKAQHDFTLCKDSLDTLLKQEVFRCEYQEGFYCLEWPQACSLSSKPGTITGECGDGSAYKGQFAVENVLTTDSHRHVWFLAACDRGWLDSHVAPPVVTYLWPRSSLAGEGEPAPKPVPSPSWVRLTWKSNILSLWVPKDKTGGSFCRIVPLQGLTYLCWRVCWLEVWNLSVQILLTLTHPSSLLVELAQQIDRETSLLLEPEQELKP